MVFLIVTAEVSLFSAWNIAVFAQAILLGHDVCTTVPKHPFIATGYPYEDDAKPGKSRPEGTPFVKKRKYYTDCRNFVRLFV